MTTLTEAITEIEAGQSHQEMLVALRARTVAKDGIAQSGRVLAYLASISKLGAIKALAADETSPLRDAADATMITLQTREGFDFSIPETVVMLQAYVAVGLLTEEQAATVQAIGATTAPEFEGLTLRQVIEVREPMLLERSYSNVVDVIDKANHPHFLIATLAEDLPCPDNITFEVRNDFGSGFTSWEGSSVNGLAGKHLAGTYTARLAGEFVKSNIAQIRVSCSYKKPISLSVVGV